MLVLRLQCENNQIYKGKDNSIGFVFPIDENGKLKAFVSCNDRPRFWIDEDDLLKQNQGLGYEENYSLDDENNISGNIVDFDFDCEASYSDGKISAKLTFYYQGKKLSDIEYNEVQVEYYVDEKYVPTLSDYVVTNPTSVKLRVFAYYKGGANNHTYVISTYATTD